MVFQLKFPTAVKWKLLEVNIIIEISWRIQEVQHPAFHGYDPVQQGQKDAKF